MDLKNKKMTKDTSTRLKQIKKLFWKLNISFNSINLNTINRTVNKHYVMTITNKPSLCLINLPDLGNIKVNNHK